MAELSVRRLQVAEGALHLPQVFQEADGLVLWANYVACPALYGALNKFPDFASSSPLKDCLSWKALGGEAARIGCRSLTSCLACSAALAGVGCL